MLRQTLPAPTLYFLHHAPALGKSATSKPNLSNLPASTSHSALLLSNKAPSSVSRYLGDVASSGCRACSKRAPCLPGLGLAYSGSMKWLLRPDRVPLEADQCAGRTKRRNLPVRHARCQPEQNPIRPVPPLALRSFIQRTHSPPFIPACLIQQCGQQVCSLSTPGRSKSPRRSVTRPRLSFCVCSRKEMGCLYQTHLCTH